MDQTCQFEVEVTEEAILAFSHLSGDWNPLHTDHAYAQTTEYGRPIAHGALLLGYVSRVLGMYIPGKRSLILSLKAQFPKPLFYPARMQVTGNLKWFNHERGTGLVHVVICDLEGLWKVVEAEVSFLLHEVVSTDDSRGEKKQDRLDESLSQPAQRHDVPLRPKLLITGGTGGIGSQLMPFMVEHYQVCCLTRKPFEDSSESAVTFQQVDVEDESALRDWLAGNPPDRFYGIVHMSVPPVQRSFISDDLASLRRHLRHAVEVPLEIARWARQPGSAVKRLVLLGSTYGLQSPQPNLGAYSIAKAAMEYLPRLLTSDLSIQGATVNVITPTVVPVGLNQGMTERTRKSLAGKIPTRRLVEPKDIAAVILFLLSEAASQVNGATLAVDGGLRE